MVNEILYSILTSVSNSHFLQYLNDEEMIKSHVMCVLQNDKIKQKKTLVKRVT